MRKLRKDEFVRNGEVKRKEQTLYRITAFSVPKQIYVTMAYPSIKEARKHNPDLIMFQYKGVYKPESNQEFDKAINQKDYEHTWKKTCPYCGDIHEKNEKCDR